MSSRRANTPNPISARPNWEASTKRDRAVYVLHDAYGGDRKEMQKVTHISASDIGAIERGTLEPTDDQMRTIASRLKCYNSAWVKHGYGQPRGPAQSFVFRGSNGNGTHNDEQPMLDHAVAGRIAYLLREHWSSNAIEMGEALGISPGEISALANAEEPASDDLLEKIVQADPRISLDFLLNGKGPAVLPAAPTPPTPAPAPVEAAATPQPAAGDAALDGLFQLLEKVRGFDVVVAGLRREVAAVTSSAAVAAEAKAEADKLRNLVNGLMAKFSTALDEEKRATRTELAAISLRLDGASEFCEGLEKRVIADEANGEELRQDLHEFRAAQLGVGVDIVGRIESLESRLDATLSAITHLGTGVTAHELRLREMDARRGDAGPVDDDLSDRLERLEDLIEGMADAVRSLAPTADAVTALAARVEALEAAKPSPPEATPARVISKTVRCEADLDPDVMMTLADWCELPGPHQRAIKGPGDKIAMGKRIHRAYRKAAVTDRSVMTTARNGGSVIATYPVSDLRLYVSWLGKAGLVPDSDEWCRHWEREYKKAK